MPVSNTVNQISFTERDIQRLERQLDKTFSQSSRRSGSSSSNNSTPTPTRKLITGRICDPIELMANLLAEELDLFSSEDISSSSDEDSFIYGETQADYRPPPPSSSSRRRSSGASSHHTRIRSGSLSSIPEEA